MEIEKTFLIIITLFIRKILGYSYVNLKFTYWKLIANRAFSLCHKVMLKALTFKLHEF